MIILDFIAAIEAIIKLPKVGGKAYPVILTSQVLKNNDQKPNNSTLIEPFFSKRTGNCKFQ